MTRVFLHISQDWSWSNGWNLVSWPYLILWTSPTVWILIYTIWFSERKIKRSNLALGQIYCSPACTFFPLLSTCIQWWAVGKRGIASTSLHCLEGETLYQTPLLSKSPPVSWPRIRLVVKLYYILSVCFAIVIGPTNWYLLFFRKSEDCFNTLYCLIFA